MRSNDSGYYKGDLQYDTFRQFLKRTRLPESWADIAEELGFPAVDMDAYWAEDNWNQRMCHDYRLFLILIENRVEYIKDLEGMLADGEGAREFLSNLLIEFRQRGITFLAIPYDILTLLVLRKIGPHAVMELGIYQWREDIHKALESILGIKLIKRQEA